MFSYNHNDEEKNSIINDFDEFIDITNLSFLDGNKKIKSYQLDILIDLTSIISHNRINMLDKSTAKIIIAYLAFPGTTGNQLYDYVLTDKIVTPELCKSSILKNFYIYLIAIKSTMESLIQKLEQIENPIIFQMIVSYWDV